MIAFAILAFAIPAYFALRAWANRTGNGQIVRTAERDVHSFFSRWGRRLHGLGRSVLTAAGIAFRNSVIAFLLATLLVAFVYTCWTGAWVKAFVLLVPYIPALLWVAGWWHWRYDDDTRLRVYARGLKSLFFLGNWLFFMAFWVHTDHTAADQWHMNGQPLAVIGFVYIVFTVRLLALGIAAVFHAGMLTVSASEGTGNLLLRAFRVIFIRQNVDFPLPEINIAVQERFPDLQRAAVALLNLSTLPVYLVAMLSMSRIWTFFFFLASLSLGTALGLVEHAGARKEEAERAKLAKRISDILVSGAWVFYYVIVGLSLAFTGLQWFAPDQGSSLGRFQQAVEAFGRMLVDFAHGDASFSFLSWKSALLAGAVLIPLITFLFIWARSSSWKRAYHAVAGVLVIVLIVCGFGGINNALSKTRDRFTIKGVIGPIRVDTVCLDRNTLHPRLFWTNDPYADEYVIEEKSAYEAHFHPVGHADKGAESWVDPRLLDFDDSQHYYRLIKIVDGTPSEPGRASVIVMARSPLFQQENLCFNPSH